MRVNITLSDELLERVNEARKNKGGMSMSNYIAMALSTQIDQDTMIRYLPKVLEIAEQQKQEKQDKMD